MPGDRKGKEEMEGDMERGPMLELAGDNGAGAEREFA